MSRITSSVGDFIVTSDPQPQPHELATAALLAAPCPECGGKAEQKQPSVCSRCAGSDPDCYICGKKPPPAASEEKANG